MEPAASSKFCSGWELLMKSLWKKGGRQAGANGIKVGLWGTHSGGRKWDS